jgi:hypothetical protein
MKHFFLSAVIIFSVLFNCQASEQEDQVAIPEFSITKVCKEFTIDAVELSLSALVVGALATIVHEWGHAIAGPMVFKKTKETQIHIGTSNSSADASLKWFSLGNMHFYKRFPWVDGQTEMWLQGAKHDKWVHEKKAFYTAAGGVSVAAFLYSALIAMMAYCSYRDGKEAGVLGTSWRKALSPFVSILETQNLSFQKKRFLMNLTFIMCISLIFNLMYGLLPLGAGDGMAIWKDEIGLSDKNLSVLQGVTVVSYVGCLIWLLKCFYSARKMLAERNRVLAGE